MNPQFYLIDKINKVKKKNYMKFKLTLLFLSLLSFVFASDYDNKNILSSAYNSVNISLSEVFGDAEGSSTTFALRYKPTPINLIFNYSSTDADVDEILGLSVFGIDAESDSFQLGYLIEGDNNSHFIPFFSTGSIDYNILGYGIEADTTTFGFLYRAIAGENSVFTFGLAFVEYDDFSASNETRTLINNALSNLNLSTLSDAEFESVENQIEENNAVFTLGLEHHVTENLSIDYGFATDFDSSSLSFGIGLNY